MDEKKFKTEEEEKDYILHYYNTTLFSCQRQLRRLGFSSVKKIVPIETIIFDQHMYFINFPKYLPDVTPTLLSGDYVLPKFLNFSQNTDSKAVPIPPPILINQIRDPVSRYISQYYFWRSLPGSFGNNVRANGSSLDECSQLGLKTKHCPPRNYITRYFCGHDPELCNQEGQTMLNTAKHNLMKHYLFVGILEELNTTLTVFSKILPALFDTGSKWNNKTKQMEKAPLSVRKRTSVAEKMRSEVPQEVEERIIKSNWMDVELFQFAKQIFDRKKELCGL